LANKITAADKGAENANKNIAMLSAHKEKGKIAYWRFRAQMNKIKVNGARGGVWLERERGLGQNNAQQPETLLYNGVAHWGNQHAMKTQGDGGRRAKAPHCAYRSGIKSTIIIQPEPNYRLHCRGDYLAWRIANVVKGVPDQVG
jgi:hypothetical protein